VGALEGSQRHSANTVPELTLGGIRVDCDGPPAPSKRITVRAPASWGPSGRSIGANATHARCITSARACGGSLPARPIALRGRDCRRRIRSRARGPLRSDRRRGASARRTHTYASTRDSSRALGKPDRRIRKNQSVISAPRRSRRLPASRRPVHGQRVLDIEAHDAGGGRQALLVTRSIAPVGTRKKRHSSVSCRP